MSELVQFNEETGELVNYKPVESLQKMAFAEVAEKHYRRARDLDGLRAAIETIWQERHAFVRWWEAQEKDKGGHHSLYADDRSVKGIKLSDFNLPPKVVSRWRQKCGKEDGLHKTIETQYLKAAKLIDPEVVNHRAMGTGENEWYTPREFIEKAKSVLGEIDLDPATSESANQVVRASNIFTENGQNKTWFGRVWMNPPYSQPAIAEFCEKLANSYLTGEVEEAIALTHNYTDTGWFHSVARACDAICFTRGRIAFESPSGEKAAPTQGQAFFYFGDNVDLFSEVFRDVGFVVIRK